MTEMKGTRKAAMLSGDRFYFTGKMCRNGHVAIRHVISGCSECTIANKKREYVKNRTRYLTYNNSRPRDYVAISNRKSYRSHRDARIKDQCEYYANNREARLIYTQSWRNKNRERDAQNAKRWRVNNPDHYRALQAARRTRVVRATLGIPALECAPFYAEARRLTAETGIPHQVDHIVPLAGKNVSGLHVPWNLRVVTKQVNLSKSNKHADEIGASTASTI